MHTLKSWFTSQHDLIKHWFILQTSIQNQVWLRKTVFIIWGFIWTKAELKLGNIRLKTDGKQFLLKKNPPTNHFWTQFFTKTLYRIKTQMRVLCFRICRSFLFCSVSLYISSQSFYFSRAHGNRCGCEGGWSFSQNAKGKASDSSSVLHIKRLFQQPDGSKWRVKCSETKTWNFSVCENRDTVLQCRQTGRMK